jgi:hypothetical protein
VSRTAVTRSDAMAADPADPNERAARLRAANIRTAVALGCIALVFYVGFIASEYFGGPAVTIGVMGCAVLLFLLVVIGRNLRR